MNKKVEKQEEPKKEAKKTEVKKLTQVSDEYVKVDGNEKLKITYSDGTVKYYGL